MVGERRSMLADNGHPLVEPAQDACALAQCMAAQGSMTRAASSAVTRKTCRAIAYSAG